MLVTFFYASRIDFGDFLNAHLRFKILVPELCSINSNDSRNCLVNRVYAATCCRIRI